MCVATRNPIDSMNNFNNGKYWDIKGGNWDGGSKSFAMPAIPEEIMSAEVVEVSSAPDLRYIYSHLGDLYGHCCDFVVILVTPTEFDAGKYWTTEAKSRSAVKLIEGDWQEWPYNFNRETWEEIQKFSGTWEELKLAIYNLPAFGIDTLKNYTEEDFKNYNAQDKKILRLAQKIAQKITCAEELLALFELTGVGSAFTANM